MMKKIACFLLAMLTVLSLVPASAESEADQYLVDKVWEMNVNSWGNVEYMFFGRDGYGFMARRYDKGYAKNYYFSWYTWEDKATCTTYIRIDFKNQEAPVNGWSNLNNPHKQACYKLRWNPDFMFFLDYAHSGTDIRSADSQRNLYIENGRYPADIEKYTRDANAQFR